MLKKIRNYFAVASFVNKIRKELKGGNYSTDTAKVQAALEAIIKHKDTLPQCLRDKPEYDYVMQILQDVLDLDVVSLESEVKAMLG